MSDKVSFFAELKRRNVYKVAVAYAVVGWLLIQVTTQVFPIFDIPNWALRLIVLAIIVGFPIALVIAWAFELTPEGLKRTEDADLAGLRGSKNRTWIYVVAIGAILSVALFVVARSTAPRTSFSTEHVGAVVLSPPVPQKSIAVLPFENLSDDKGAAYFADGIQDEILSKLASIADLKVISRTSTAKYKSKPEDLKTVSKQLGVATVLEGSVQKAADKVRVIVQFIDARTDSHLWARTYDRDLADVFAIQSEVAQEIADSLQAKLSPAEASTVATAPTKDAAAYDFFLKGEYQQRAALSEQIPEPFDQAAAWYKDAIARDPNFALAMARLVVCRMRRHWLVESLNQSEVLETGKMAKEALTLAPNLAEAHVALGVFHYYGFRQYDLALAEFQRAMELQPNNAEALQFVGYVHRRQGQWLRSVDELRRSLEQDPRNPSVLGNIAQSYSYLRKWKEVEDTARHALTIDPHEATSMGMWLLSCLNQNGDEQEALRVLTTFPADDLLVPNGGTLTLVIGRRAETFVLSRNFEAALKTWETSRTQAYDGRQRLSATTAIRVLAGDITGARIDAEKVRPALETRLLDHPGEGRSMRALSWVYLALNRNDDAINIAKQALTLVPPEKDAPLGSGNLASLAEIQARTGAAKEAVENLRHLLSIPAGETVSLARLKIDPVWDPIRNDPGFQQLLAGREQIGPNQ
jgi:TolB-like protein/cytochrome c-type biogenesis protein CcmH/NrfG